MGMEGHLYTRRNTWCDDEFKVLKRLLCYATWLRESCDEFFQGTNDLSAILWF